MGADTAHTRHLAGSIPASLHLLVLGLNLLFFIFWIIRLLFSNSFIFFNWRTLSFGNASLIPSISVITTLAVLSVFFINTLSLESSIYFFSHFEFRPKSFSLLKFAFFFIAASVVFIRGYSTKFEPANLSLINLALFECSFVLTPYLMFCLVTSTNFFTSVIILEGLSLLSLLLYLINFSNETLKTTLSGFLFFFWINAITSLLFFTSVIVLTGGGLLLSFDKLLLFQHVDDMSFIWSIFLLTIFFKLALPPFLIWKVIIFNKASSAFIGYYSACFFPPLLYFVIGIADAVFFKLDPQVASPYTLFLGVVLASSLLSISLSLYAGTAGSFFAISGTITTFLISIIFFCNETSFEFSVRLSLLLYLMFYSFTLLFGFSLLMRGFFRAGSQHVSSLFSFGLKSNVSQIKAKILSTLFVLTLSLFAGLPPFVTFYIKLFVLSNLVYVFSSTQFILFFLLFFFTLLYFYSKNIRFALVQPNLLQQSRVRSASVLNSEMSYVNMGGEFWSLDPFVIFLSFFGFFFLSETVALIV